MIRNLILITLIAIGFNSTSIAQNEINLEDIWKNYKFYSKGVPGFNFMNDGETYTRKEGNKIQQYDFTSGNFVATIFEQSFAKDLPAFQAYSFSDDESKILFETEREQIYRRSSKAFFYIWDRNDKKLMSLHEDGKQMYATLNPAADKVAFVSDNNLYYKDLKTGRTTRITDDGEYNKIINGASDWVYEEEFALARAFEWSPDGNQIAFLRFDESAVEEFTMQVYNDELYPENVTFKYPKVGENNSIVTAHVYDLDRRRISKMNTGNEKDIYLPRIRWTKEGDLCIFRMNRHQNHLELLVADTKRGRSKVMFEEKEDQYIAESMLDNITFLEDGNHFVMTSERDGYHHVYLHDMKGREKRQLTKGKWDVTSFYGVDEKNETVFYQAAKENPMQKHVYSVNLNGRKDQQLSKEDGTNSASFSSTFDYYTLSHSTINTPTTYAVYNRDGRLMRELEDNENIRKLQRQYDVSPVEFFDFETSEGVSLNGWMIKPPNFKKNREYPVFMYLYGGPGSQQVVDGWKGQNYWWFQMLAQQGFIVACVDNRGTGARGEEFKKITYQQLGHYETIDQIEAAKYLAGLKYTDANRIGIFGWSYGGYMSSLCLLKGNDVFKAAIAVAPVTSWKWYDTIYTERFMRTLKENPEGYQNNSPVYFADRLKGNYLLVHGIADDNVHYQHTVEMTNALISANKQFDTYAYPNRNHGIYGDNARLHLYTKMTNFLHEKLMDDDAPVGGGIRP